MRILIAWEMGGNFGHITQIVNIAEALEKRGADIYLCLKSPDTMKLFANNFMHHLLQAPYALSGPYNVINYPDELRNIGYDSPDTLVSLIKKWQLIFSTVKPDVLLTEAAPTALLAAKECSFVKAAFGRGYSIPPLSVPMPNMESWKENDHKVLEEHEKIVLDNINQACDFLKLPRLNYFAEFLEVDEQFLCTIPEVDHYPLRGKATYYGPIDRPAVDESVYWREDGEIRCFAYLDNTRPILDSCLGAFQMLPPEYDVIIVSSGVAEQRVKRVNSTYSHIQLFDRPVNVNNILPTCDIVISHGGSGLTLSAIVAGAPLLMFPNHLEQRMVAASVRRQGAGVSAEGVIDTDQFKELVEKFLSNRQLKKNAENIRDKYINLSREKSIRWIADRIETLAG